MNDCVLCVDYNMGDIYKYIYILQPLMYNSKRILIYFVLKISGHFYSEIL